MFCLHQWEIISNEIVTVTHPNTNTQDMNLITLQCKKCGDVKGKTIKIEP